MFFSHRSALYLSVVGLTLSNVKAEAEDYKKCTPVSVQGDATYCIKGPVCSGKSGYGNCPTKGAISIDGCQHGAKSFDYGSFAYSKYRRQCRLVKDSKCVKIDYHTYGCALDHGYKSHDSYGHHIDYKYKPNKKVTVHKSVFNKKQDGHKKHEGFYKV